MSNKQLMDLMDVQYYPVEFNKKDLAKYKPISFNDVGVLGSSFALVVETLQSISNQETLYRFDMRGYTGEMTKLKDGSGFLSTITKPGEGIVGQGAYVPVSTPLNMPALITAVALIAIDQKLSTIIETQNNIFDFLRAKEKAQLKANLETLIEVMSQYKFKWENNSYKQSKLVLIQTIKKESLENIMLNKEFINKILGKKKLGLLKKEIQKQMETIMSYMEEYQLAVYLYSFSYFLEVVLTGVFTSDYLNDVVKNIEKHTYDFRQVYTNIYNKMDESLMSSIDVKIESSKQYLTKMVDERIAKAPFINKAIGSSQQNSVIEKQVSNFVTQLQSFQGNVAVSFIENIKVLDRIMNDTPDIIFDSNQLFIEITD